LPLREEYACSGEELRHGGYRKRAEIVSMPRPPIETAHLIRQYDTLHLEPIRKRDFEWISFYV